jgi:hypothetical protein
LLCCCPLCCSCCAVAVERLLLLLFQPLNLTFLCKSDRALELEFLTPAKREHGDFNDSKFVLHTYLRVKILNIYFCFKYTQ